VCEREREERGREREGGGEKYLPLLTRDPRRVLPIPVGKGLASALDTCEGEVLGIYASIYIKRERESEREREIERERQRETERGRDREGGTEKEG
jgi:hypothetical protein